MNASGGPSQLARFRGCLLGGAVGDALGAAVEFVSRREILHRFGASGIRELVETYGRKGAITDDTQMTLFCAEGMLRAQVRAMTRGIGPVYSSVTSHAYLRWLLTQGIRHPLLDQGHDACPGWLIQHSELFHQRAPGRTCLAALTQMHGFGEPATNDSKGCGAVMRVAPIGLMYAHAAEREGLDARIFDLAVEDAAITHGHSSGQLPAGFLALLVALVARGNTLQAATSRAQAELDARSESAETTTLVNLAVKLAETEPRTPDALSKLGEGWIAEEALAIALYCALCADSFESGIVLAVNHDGDSDSTGAITGNILGALLGEECIPGRWLADLEARDIIEQVADDLASFWRWDLDVLDNTEESKSVINRYPPF